MLTNEYFKLALEIHHATTFARLADLLSNRLPPLVGGDSGVLFLTHDGGEIREVHGVSDRAEDTDRKAAMLDDLFSSEPLRSKVTLENPGDLGFSLRDYVTEEDFRTKPVFRRLREEEGIEDGMFGMIAGAHQRTTMLVICRHEGAFDAEQKALFDALLLTARSVARVIMHDSVRNQLQKFYMETSPEARMALFVVNPNAEVLPFNHDALRLVEQEWNADEPFRSLEADDFRRIQDELIQAWTDPFTATFRSLRADIGGGLKDFHGLPGTKEGEVYLIHSLSSTEKLAEEHLKALLTKRQCEIMEWTAEGKTAGETGIILDISPRTVEKHLEAIFQRLGVENRISAVRRYMELKSGGMG